YKVTWMRRAFEKINHISKPAFGYAEKFTSLASRLYDRSIDYSLARPARILLISLGVGVVGIALLCFLPRSLFPDVDQGVVEAEVEMPPGTTLAENEALQQKIHGFLSKNNLAAHAITTLGFESDDLASQVKGIKHPNYSRSIIYIDRDRMTSREFNETLSGGLSNFANIKTTFRIKGEALQELLGETSPVIVAEVEHRSRTRAREAALALRESIQKTKGIVNISSTAGATEPEVKVFVDREKIAAQGLTIESIARTIHSAVNGTIATGYREGDHEIGVRLRLREEDRNSLDHVRRLLVPVGDGKQMEVGTFIRPQEGTGHSAVLRENQRRVEQIRVEYEKSERKTVFAELEQAISNTRASYAKEPDENRPQLRLREDNEETSESLAGLVYAFAISAVLIYMLLAGQFESLIHPITLALIIPLMLFGVSTALLITGHGLNISSAIGIILLAGIVVDSATVLYEYIEQQRGDAGHDGSDIALLPEILKKCGHARIRAILLTSLTNMLGSLPSAGLASSGNLQAPMAVAIVGGLIVATVLTLVAFPTMFLVVETFRHRVRQNGTLLAIKSLTARPAA
ncbi:MAG TPA: efflux RND transporter permease subunit, partial [Leptospiraceae bacterium]|nr:efflux RND transporter permease subunit [Leptospiraceae bacterium]